MFKFVGGLLLHTVCSGTAAVFHFDSMWFIENSDCRFFTAACYWFAPYVRAFAWAGSGAVHGTV